MSPTRFRARPVPLSCTGFSLVEILIVLSILTILSGLLFPTFAAAREKARQATCLSNERQLGAALLLYAQDYDEAFPSGTTDWTGKGWAGQMYPGLKTQAVFRCPDDTKQPHSSDDGDAIDPLAIEVSYALNTNAAGRPLSAFSVPSLTDLIFEVNDAAASFSAGETTSPTGRGYPHDTTRAKPFGADYYATGNIGGESPRLCTTIRPYHDPTSNFLAADGHVKAFRPEQVSAGKDAPAPSAPQSTANGTAAGTESMVISQGIRAALTFSIR